ncbi:MAG: hypothetical protein IKK52_03500 [Alphaproteobacteria bacterium]|nr:hypothetical protein [Alphaproteobacteria bacterium]
MSSNNIPVFIEGQDDLIDLLATAICSICYNTKSYIDFYVLDCGICPFNKKQLESLKAKFSNFSIEFIPIDLKRFDGMKGWPPPKYQFVDCYARLLIPELKPEINKAIYLDSDIIALDDIKLLYDQNLDGFETGMVADIGYASPYFENCTQNLDISPEHIYANAGMILLDCKKWRENQTTERLLEIGRKFKDHLLVLNEDILSVYYNKNRYKRLENRFNLTDLDSHICKNVAPQITDEYLANEWKHVVVYHFCHGKPFKQMKNNYNGRPLRHFDSFWFFASMTPFYAGMKLRLVENNETMKSNATNKEEYSLFNIIPLLAVHAKQQIKRYKLFGFLPIMKKKRK